MGRVNDCSVNSVWHLDSLRNSCQTDTLNAHNSARQRDRVRTPAHRKSTDTNFESKIQLINALMDPKVTDHDPGQGFEIK